MYLKNIPKKRTLKIPKNLPKNVPKRCKYLNIWKNGITPFWIQSAKLDRLKEYMLGIWEMLLYLRNAFVFKKCFCI